jgi:MarR family transcriptional regulator, organic hydroperoxide resistance regulator
MAKSMEHPLEACLGFHLIQLMKAHRYYTETRLHEVGLYAGQEIIMFHLWHDDGLAQSQLAESIGVEAPTITKMVQRMAASGLVERRADPQDARVSRVFLTEKGRDLEPAVRAIWEQLEAKLTSGLSDVETALLSRMIAQMRSNMGNMGRTQGCP